MSGPNTPQNPPPGPPPGPPGPPGGPPEQPPPGPPFPGGFQPDEGPDTTRTLPRALKRPPGPRGRIKPIRERNPIAIAVIGLAVLVGLSMLAYRADDLPLIGGGTTYTAHFSESAGLDPDDEVRVAGVKVGEVTGVELDGAKVEVTFRVRDTWIGSASTAGIMIKTLLGDKYLAVDPLGPNAQDPDRTIPLERTVSPYDVTQAFQDLSRTIDRVDTAKVAQSLDVLADTFEGTPPHVRQTLKGMSDLSKTIHTRDAKLARLLSNAKQLTGVLDRQSGEFERLIRDGNLLLAELSKRRQAIHGLLVGSRKLAQQLSGLVNDNAQQLRPTLVALDRITAVLERNQKSLGKALAIAGPYQRLLGNALGNGRWMDGYLCGVVPKEYQAPGTPPKEGCKPPKQEGGR